MEEFEGYFNKEDFTINKFDENNMPIWPEKVRLNKLNDTQLIKQADIVMLLLLLGEEFDDETKKLNYHYYEKRTMHKSSLSPSMYAIMGMRIGEYNNAYEHFLRSALVDLKDNQGNTSEGLHMASAGGTWQVAILGFGGMHVDEDGILCFDPYLPDKWNSIRFKIHWRGNVLDIHILKDNVAIEVVEEKRKHEEELKIKVKGNILTL
jgi:kojibiose phosphorylase